MTDMTGATLVKVPKSDTYRSKDGTRSVQLAEGAMIGAADAEDFGIDVPKASSPETAKETNDAGERAVDLVPDNRARAKAPENR